MKRDQAEAISLQALAYLLSQDELTGLFLSSSGIAPDELRQRATDPHFLGAVLDFLLQDDAWVIGFAQMVGLAPQDVQVARAALPGGQVPHWT